MAGVTVNPRRKAARRATRLSRLLIEASGNCDTGNNCPSNFGGGVYYCNDGNSQYLLRVAAQWAFHLLGFVLSLALSLCLSHTHTNTRTLCVLALALVLLVVLGPLPRVQMVAVTVLRAPTGTSPN